MKIIPRIKSDDSGEAVPASPEYRDFIAGPEVQGSEPVK